MKNLTVGLVKHIVRSIYVIMCHVLLLSMMCSQLQFKCLVK